MELFKYVLIGLLFFEYITCIDINLLYFPNNSNEEYIDNFVKEFNTHSKNNDLDITLIKNNYKSISSVESYLETIDYLLNTNSNKYDLIYLDIIYSNQFIKHFEDLNNYLPQYILNNYNDNIARDFYIINNKFITLPLYLEYNMLYYNKDLLDKYSKSVPTKWSELIETAKYIISEEKKFNNEIIGYTADMTDTEVGFSSFYEYIYSYRKDISSPFPVITNPEVVDAMKTLKLLKDELGERGIRSNNNDIKSCLNSSKCLFVKTLNNVEHNDRYLMTNIPGNNEGVSGSCIGGYGLAINKYITDIKKEKISKIMEFIVSMEYEKKTTLNYGFQSAIKEIYNDESICQNYVQCQNFQNIQPVLRPVTATNDYKEYSQKYRNNLLKYLYEGVDIDKCLQNIKFLTDVFYEKQTTLMNVIYMTVIGVSDLIMIGSYCLAFTEKHEFKFRLLSKFYWFLYMLGDILIMSYGFTGMGKLTDIKCQLRPLIFSLGFSLTNTVIFIRMLINFPESERSFSRFCARNFGKTLLFSIGIDVILNAIGLIKPYKVGIVIDGNIMYQTCKLDGTIGFISFALLLLYKAIIILGMAVLTFIEWNMQEFMHDVRNVTATLFISIIICVLFGLVQNIGGYKERFLFPASITYIYGFSSFTVYFIVRFFTNYDEDTEEATIKKILQFQESAKSDNPLPGSLERAQSLSNGTMVMQKKLSIVDHLVNLHTYGDEIRKSIDNSKMSSNSSDTDLSATRTNIRKNSKCLSVDSFKNYDESFSMMRRASQITAIPENGIAYSNSNTSFDNKFSIGPDSIHSDENIHNNRSRTSSYENFNPSFTRTSRINSTPNKNFLSSGLVSRKSYDNFADVPFMRRNSNISFTNGQRNVSYSNLKYNISNKDGSNSIIIKNNDNSDNQNSPEESDTGESSNQKGNSDSSIFKNDNIDTDN